MNALELAAEAVRIAQESGDPEIIEDAAKIVARAILATAAHAERVEETTDRPWRYVAGSAGLSVGRDGPDQRETATFIFSDPGIVVTIEPHGDDASLEAHVPMAALSRILGHAGWEVQRSPQGKRDDAEAEVQAGLRACGSTLMNRGVST